ncbi:MAG: glycosyltransferase family 39 protein [Bacteroidales bacterium]|nr:glycosyltransferase family 39 protein [Lentimicrobiaceae bacterium]MDD5696223.1 glycosyltransferase family 39 protein [Bacteroidales bacterium]
MDKNDFNTLQLLLLMSGGICLIISMFFHIKEREKVAVLLLVIAALFVNLFSATLDPFLNLWDERFHALVAKNLMNHPFRPTLYDDPVVDMAYDRWDRYNIWLHKQPLFLWQIALSFKIFGVSEFTLRIPSVILGAFLVLAGYRSGRLLVSKRAGFITGLLIMTCPYWMELIAGRQEVDHNDVSFVTYVSLSIWALMEYHSSRRKGWIWLIGLFSGMAVLCKWLTGLLVYLGWMILILQEWKSGYRQWILLLQALLVTVIVALPWQVFALIQFPEEARTALGMNSRHFFESIDGHRGDFGYHFRQIGTIYGRLTPYLMVPAWVVLFFRSGNRKLCIAILIMVIAVYLFFSFATTKMPSFTLITGMLVFIVLAGLIDLCLDLLKKINMPVILYQCFILAAFLVIIVWRFDLQTIRDKHTLRKQDNIYTQWLTHNRQVFESLELPPGTVLFNVKGRHYIEAMFHTGFPAYNFVPSEEQYRDMMRKGRKAAIFLPPGCALPEYMAADTNTLVISDQLKGWD